MLPGVSITRSLGLAVIKFVLTVASISPSMHRSSISHFKRTGYFKYFFNNSRLMLVCTIQSLDKSIFRISFFMFQTFGTNINIKNKK